MDHALYSICCSLEPKRTVVKQGYPAHAFYFILYGTGKYKQIPDSKVHGASMRPIWGRQDPGGPHGGPMNFAIWDDLGSNTVWSIKCAHVLICFVLMISRVFNGSRDNFIHTIQSCFIPSPGQ